MKNNTHFKSLNRFESDPRVVRIYSEDDNFDRPDVWIDLAAGYNWFGCSSVHESSVARAIAAMRNVRAGNPY